MVETNTKSNIFIVCADLVLPDREYKIEGNSRILDGFEDDGFENPFGAGFLPFGFFGFDNGFEQSDSTNAFVEVSFASVSAQN